MKTLTKFLTFCAIAVSASCATQPVDTKIGCPPGPDVWGYGDGELWRATPEQIRETIINNEAEWEAWYDAACGRIQDHDERLAM